MNIKLKQEQHIEDSEAGFMVTEAQAALLIFLLLLPGLLFLFDLGMSHVKKRVIADHLNRVAVAAQGYTRKHYETLFSGATATTGASVSLSTLRSEGFLPSGFSDVNAWGQGYSVSVRKPSTDRLQTIILTTGGRGASASDQRFANVLVPSTAAMAGGNAGYIPTGTISGQSSDELRGSYGGWVLNLAASGLSSPGAGHLGAMADLTSQDVGQDFLYRVKVPGHPELNAMTTELDMTDHAINNVKSVKFQSHTLAEMSGFCTTAIDEGRTFLDAQTGLYICRNGQIEAVADSGNSTLFKEATVAVNGAKVKKPVCPAGSNTHPEIFVSPAIAEAGADAPAIVALQAWAVSLSDDEWQINMRLLTADTTLGWIYPAADYGRVMVFTTCAKD